MSELKEIIRQLKIASARFMMSEDQRPAIFKAIKIIKDSEWISVDDRLPSKSGPYMTFNGKDEKPSCIQQRVHIYDSDYKWFNSDTVTHWKPLPEPPK